MPAKRVLLISPPRFNELIGKNPAIVEKHRGHNPPLGLLCLAGYVEANSAHQVQVLDAQAHDWSYERLRAEISSRSFDVAGLTAMTFTLLDVLRTCQIIREVRPAAKIVLGGPHVHLFPNETMARPEVDYLIQGEGEVAFLKLLEALDVPGGLDEVRGLVYRDANGGVVNNGIAPSAADLDTLGFPARHKLDPRLYGSLLGRSGMTTTMFTSRGCPFRCTFCDRPYSPVISGFRSRSAMHVVDEIEACIGMGIREALIYDDTFTVRKDRVHAICDEIIKRSLDFRWDVRAHVNTVDRDLLAHMAEAGCDRIHFGVEAGNDRMLGVIRKNTTVEKVKKVFSLAAEEGIERLAYFIIGQQTERESDIEDSVALAKSLRPDYVHFTIFCPYPGTQIYAEGLQRGIIKEDVWQGFARDPRPDFELPVWEEHFTRAQLQELLVKCYKSFYLRPTYMLRRLGRIRSPSELARKARAGLSVVTMKPKQKLELG